MSDANTEALKIALEALKTCDPGESGGFTYEGTYPSYDKRSVENAIAAIEAVLSPPSVAEVNVQESEREYPIPPETVMPRGEAYGDVLDMLYAAWHREAPGDTFAAIGAAIQEIQALRAQPPAVQVPQWISVDERLPEDRQDVLFVVDCKNPRYEYLHGRVLGGKYIAGNPGYFSVPGLGVNASYWMLSPAAPSPSSQGGE